MTSIWHDTTVGAMQSVVIKLLDTMNNMNVRSQRKMRDSGVAWIGEVPEGWGVFKIKHLATQRDSLFIDGDWINSDVIVSAGVRYLTSGNVGPGYFKNQGDGYISSKTFSDLHCLKVFPGDLMMCRLNEPIGRACIVPSGEEYYVIAVDNVVLRPDSGNVRRYLMYALNCEGFSKEAYMAAAGTTMKRISRSELGNLWLPIPPEAQQQAIADYLDRECGKIDALRTKIEAQISDLATYKKSVITEAVTGKCKIENGEWKMRPRTELRDSGIAWIGEVPEGWTCSRVRYHFEIITGSGFKPEIQGRNSGDYPVCKASDISAASKNLLSAANWITLDEARRYKFNIIPQGSVLMAKIGEAMRKNNRAIAKLNCCLDNNCQGLSCVNIHSDFAYYLLTQVDMAWFDNGGTIPCLNNSQLKDCRIAVPSHPEQREIADYLDKKCAAIDAAVAKCRAQLEDLATYKKSLIFECVTGKKEIA